MLHMYALKYHMRMSFLADSLRATVLQRTFSDTSVIKPKIKGHIIDDGHTYKGVAEIRKQKCLYKMET